MKSIQQESSPEPRRKCSSPFLQIKLLNELSNLAIQLLDEHFRPSIRILRRMLSIVKTIYRHLDKLLRQAQQKKQGCVHKD